MRKILFFEHGGSDGSKKLKRPRGNHSQRNDTKRNPLESGGGGGEKGRRTSTNSKWVLTAMDGFTRNDLRTALELSSMCVGVFDDRNGRVHSLNRALKQAVKRPEFRVTVTSQTDDRMFGRLVEGEYLVFICCICACAIIVK